VACLTTCEALPAGAVIRQVQESGVSSLRGVAAALNARGVRTARGGKWAATQVGAVLARAESPRVRG
jgi:hypothetical protein